MSTVGSTPPIGSIALVLGALCITLIFIFFVLPFLAHVMGVFEALSIMIQGIGEYVGNTTLVWLGCAAIAMILAACCLIPIVLIAASLTCQTANPSQICGLFAR